MGRRASGSARGRKTRALSKSPRMTTIDTRTTYAMVDTCPDPIVVGLACPRVTALKKEKKQSEHAQLAVHIVNKIHGMEYDGWTTGY